MNILALDCGTKTGWAARGALGIVESGIQTFDIRRGESPGMRFIRFNAWLEEMFAYIAPHVVTYELAHHRGGAPTVLLVGMTTRVDEFCARHGIEHAAVHSATLKKSATGSGRAEKGAMIEAAKKLYPWIEILSDDHADALMLLACFEKQIGSQSAPRG